MQKLPVILLAVGVVVAAGAILFGWLAFPAIIKSKISSTIRLEQGGDTYKKWENIPIPILMKVHLFNVTNPRGVEKGDKPVVQEIGPYVYEQKRRKININVNETEDSIEYQQLIDYHFRPDLSEGSESDSLTVINLPLVGMIAKLMKGSDMARAVAIDEVNEVSPNEPAFVDTTVGTILFGGYHVRFIQALAELKGEELLPNNTFGLYFNKNGTTKDWLSVYSGVEDGSKFGNIATFNNKSSLEYWEDEYCNMINGSDGALFPPFVTRDRRLDIFSPDLCRSLYLEYDSDVELQGLVGYRFTLPKKVLEDPRVSEENRCFCTDPGNEELDKCPKKGAYQLESCRRGAPIVVSLPHFLDGDEEYLNNCLGLEPDRSKHETFITLEPNTGVLLEAKKRIQINLDVRPSRFLKQLKKLPKVILPVFWADESAALTKESAERLKNKLIKPQELANAGSWGVFGVGCLLILVAVIIFVLRSRKDRSLNLSKQ